MNLTKKASILMMALFFMLLSMSAIASASSDALFWGFTGLICAFYIIMIIVWIIIAIWVYRDAEKRDSSGALWLLIVLLTGIIGLIIWFVIRPPIGGEKKIGHDRRCPACGRPIPMDAQVCPYCGKDFRPRF